MIIVADVGNSRMKWGRCSHHQVDEVVHLPLLDEAAWQQQATIWAAPLRTWILSGSNPPRQYALRSWLEAQGEKVRVIDRYQQLPIEVAVEKPEQVGLDRLFDALAVVHRHTREKALPAIVIDAGSAVTVDLVDERGAFRGGAILPGLRLQSQALHQYTAQLPLVDLRRPFPPTPGTSTLTAIRSGIFASLVGGVQWLCQQYRPIVAEEPKLFVTGGDAELLLPALLGTAIHWPDMTLDGLRVTSLVPV